jgi:hypothetical protein
VCMCLCACACVRMGEGTVSQYTHTHTHTGDLNARRQDRQPENSVELFRWHVCNTIVISTILCPKRCILQPAHDIKILWLLAIKRKSVSMKYRPYIPVSIRNIERVAEIWKVINTIFYLMKLKILYPAAGRAYTSDLTIQDSAILNYE